MGRHQKLSKQMAGPKGKKNSGKVKKAGPKRNIKQEKLVEFMHSNLDKAKELRRKSGQKTKVGPKAKINAKSDQVQFLFAQERPGTSNADAKKTTKVRLDLDDGAWEDENDEMFSSVALEKLKLSQREFTQNETAKVSDLLDGLEETFLTCSDASKPNANATIEETPESVRNATQDFLRKNRNTKAKLDNSFVDSSIQTVGETSEEMEVSEQNPENENEESASEGEEGSGMEDENDSGEEEDLKEAAKRDKFPYPKMHNVQFEAGINQKGNPCVLYNGFQYNKHRKNGDGTINYRCSVADTYDCTAAVTCNDELIGSFNGGRHLHNVAVIINRNQRRQLRNQCREKIDKISARKPTTNLMTEETSAFIRENPDFNASNIDFLRVDINRVKRKNNYAFAFRDANSDIIPKEFWSGSNGDVFIQHDSIEKPRKGKKWQRIIIMASNASIDLLRGQHTLSLDGTFYARPLLQGRSGVKKKEAFAQLVIVCAMLGKKAVPALFALVQKKSKDTYAYILEFLKFKEVKPRLIISDFERSISAAVGIVFKGECQSAACFFHLCQSWYRRFVEFGNKQLQLESGTVRAILSMSFSLAYVPILVPGGEREGEEDHCLIRRAFTILLEDSPRDQPGLQSWFFYLAANYLGLCEGETIETFVPGYKFTDEFGANIERYEMPVVNAPLYPPMFWNICARNTIFRNIPNTNNAHESCNRLLKVHMGNRVIMSEYLLRLSDFLEGQMNKADLFKRNIDTKPEDQKMKRKNDRLKKLMDDFKVQVTPANGKRFGIEGQLDELDDEDIRSYLSNISQKLKPIIELVDELPEAEGAEEESEEEEI